MERVDLREWSVEVPRGVLDAPWSRSATDASTIALAGSDLFHMPGIREIDHLSTLGRDVAGDFTFGVTVEVEGAAFADAAGILLRGAISWLKVCLERTKSGQWSLVTVASCPCSDEAHGARAEAPKLDLLVTRESTRTAVLWRRDADDSWHFARTLSLPLVGQGRVGLFAQAPFSKDVRARFSDARWSSKAMRDQR